MIPWLTEFAHDAVPRVLLLGAHCDDIEIGCGGTLQVLAERFSRLDVYWSVFGSTKERETETRRAMDLLLPSNVNVRCDIRSFRDTYFPYVGAEIKDHMNGIRERFSPDMIFTHFEDDRHQDHRVVSELTHNAFRDHLILEYEVFKYDGDLASPNVFVPLDASQVEKKVEVLVSAFQSQLSRPWFTEDAFKALMRLRGIESNSPSRFAEAFHCRKIRLFH